MSLRLPEDDTLTATPGLAGNCMTIGRVKIGGVKTGDPYVDDPYCGFLFCEAREGDGIIRITSIKPSKGLAYGVSTLGQSRQLGLVPMRRASLP